MTIEKITRRTKGKIKNVVHNTVESGLFNVDGISHDQAMKHNVVDFIRSFTLKLEAIAELIDGEKIKYSNKSTCFWDTDTYVEKLHNKGQNK